MYAERHTLTVETDASGDGTGYTPVVTGRIISIRYVKDGSTPYADGVDFDVTAEVTGEVIWDQDNVNASVTVAPRQATHNTQGTAALYAAGGEAVRDHIILASDRVKIVVSNGGASKTGTFHVLVA